jgi:hypothetical protein
MLKSCIRGIYIHPALIKTTFTLSLCVECANMENMWEVEIPKKNDTTTTTTTTTIKKKFTGDDDDVGDDNDGLTIVRMIFDRDYCDPSTTKVTNK